MSSKSGPKTPGGKARVALNRLKHGLRPRSMWRLMPGEDAGAYGRLEEGVVDALKPRDKIERWLAVRSARAMWLADRAHRLQTEALIAECEQGERPALQPFDGAALAAASPEAIPAMIQHNLALAEAKARPAHPVARLATSLLCLADYEQRHEGAAFRCWAEIERRRRAAGKAG